jgi:hypothetical protein
MLNSWFRLSFNLKLRADECILVLTALNLTSLGADGPLPYDHIPDNRSFKVSNIVPFATNVQFQSMSYCVISGLLLMLYYQYLNARQLLGNKFVSSLMTASFP